MTFPAIRPVAPSADSLEAYDLEQALTYARLLSAERDGLGWEESARTILQVDAETRRDAAYRCWQTHLARAHWLVSVGWARAVEEAHAG